MRYLDREKLEKYAEMLKIKGLLPNSENDKWYNQALQDILDAINNGCFELDYKKPKYAKEIGKVNWVIGKLFYSKLLFKPRMKQYGSAYEQGRFDEWIELTNNLGRYSDDVNDVKEEAKCQKN